MPSELPVEAEPLPHKGNGKPTQGRRRSLATIWSDLDALVALLLSKPFAARRLNIAFYLSFVALFSAIMIWLRLHPFVEAAREEFSVWDAITLPLLAFLMAGVLGISFHVKDVKPKPLQFEAFELEILASQTTRLVELRDQGRLRWLSAVVVLHVAVFSLFGWLMEHDAPFNREPWNGLVALSNTALALVSLSGAASIAENTYRTDAAVAFLARGGDGPVTRFFRVVRQPTPMGIVHLVTTMGLFALGSYWALVAINNWASILSP